MIVNNAYLNSLLLEYSPLCALFRKNDGEIRFVGGVVREALKADVDKHYSKNLHETNIDMVTNLNYDQTIRLLSTNNIKIIINNKLNQSCTISYNNTLITITSILLDWESDAKKRDLTINALYYDFDKKLYDYSGGFTDLMFSNISLINDLDTSLELDPFIIIRYLRFHASHGNTKISSTMLHKLENYISKSYHLINKNKLTIEIFKLLNTDNKNIKNTIMSLENTQIMQIIFSSNSVNYNDLLYLLDTGYKIGPLLLMYTFLEYSCKKISNVIQITNKQLAYLEKIDYITTNINKIFDMQDIILSNTYNKNILFDCLFISFVKKRNILFKYKNDEFAISTIKMLDKVLAFIDRLKVPKFEVTNYDLLQLDYNPKHFQDILFHCKKYWYDNNYLSKEKCIEWITDFYNTK